MLTASFSEIDHHLERPVRPPRTPRAAQVALYLSMIAAFVGALVAPGASARSSTVYERRWLEDRLMEAITHVRAQRGRAPIRISARLSEAARQHSTEMIEDGYFAHDGVRLSYARRLAVYYARSRRHTWKIGEILAWGSPSLSPAEAVSLWLRSREHRDTLLAAGWREIGISAMHSNSAPGVFQGLDVTVITVDFGAR